MSFSISIEKNPGDDRNIDQEDRVLDVEFTGIDFDELHNLIGIKLPENEVIEGGSFLNHQELVKKMYFEAANQSGYEMLGRIWFFYDDVVYLPTEVNKLLEECLKLKEKHSKPNATKALDKIVFACKEALLTNSGIFLGSD